jgi:hypothetical protein
MRQAVFAGTLFNGTTKNLHQDGGGFAGPDWSGY